MVLVRLVNFSLSSDMLAHLIRIQRLGNLQVSGNTFELIHESVWIASHMTFTKHFSPNGNIGDIVAKDDAQMSTAHLLGMLTGVGLITISHSPLFLFGVFAVLSPMNIWFTVKMLHAAEFEILNQARLTLLSREFIDSGKVIEYDQLKDREVGFGEWIKPGKSTLKIKLGPSAEQAYGSSEEVADASSNDVIRSILHSLRFHDQIKKSNTTKESDWQSYIHALEDSLAWSKDHYPKFVAELDQKNWQSNIVYWNDSGMRLAWRDHEKKRTF
ncbi:vitamin B6 photo-protection and homoeostasis-domain-containing protein [Blakeslea trispora]|nr:vitamin B6 photo-protection and homoeostasis-domain-containing protein [Blakeslea trispora]